LTKSRRKTYIYVLNLYKIKREYENLKDYFKAVNGIKVI